MDFADIVFLVGSFAVIPTIIFAFVAQYKVVTAFDRYAKVPSHLGITAAELARRLLDENGLSHIKVVLVQGHLSDHYDSRRKHVALSYEVFHSHSLAAFGIAAHEVGHAIQDKEHYFPLVLRHLVIKSTNLINKFLLPMVLIGVVGMIFSTFMSDLFWLIFTVSMCVIYGISFLVNIITLPTEYNASNRAKTLLRKGRFVADQKESIAISKVLGAAALTYLASMLVSLAYFLQFLGQVLMLFRRD
jgi:Zn-dependent membrane protease YugP